MAHTEGLAQPALPGWASKALGFIGFGCFLVILLVVGSCAGLFTKKSPAVTAQQAAPQVVTPYAEHTVFGGERFSAAMGDLKLKIPAKTTRMVCVSRATYARHFWTDPPSAPLELAPECDEKKWYLETPTYSPIGPRLMTRFGFRNGSDQDITVMIHNSP